MTDTPESVRKAVQDYAVYVATHHGIGVELLAIGRNYATLLERIEKAPRALIVNDFAVSAIPFGYSNDEKMQLLEGQRVALLQVEE